MPSFNFYKEKHRANTNGQARKFDSDMIMDATWWEDINSRVGYFYDMQHDTHPLQLNDLHPEYDDYKFPIDIKFVQHELQTFSKDSVTYHLQFRPGQKNVVDYYEQDFVIPYGSTFPCGLYVDIQDESQVWNRWLVVNKADADGTQFPTYELLRCDFIARFIINNVKCSFASVLRSQNS